jgi:glycosyltransferase involved in cell wall biosynthesis
VTSRLNVVEPTLEDYSGHCHALVASLARAATGVPVDLWSGRGSADMAFGPGVTIHPLFRRRIRLPQMFHLLRRLLRGSGQIVVTTARRSDLVLVDLAARGRVSPNHVFLYFHWFRETPRRLSFLRKMAARQPETVILGTTASVVDVFRRSGFANVVLLRYPAPPPAREAEAAPFRRLLYAGAARQDKGFGIVVDLVELLVARKENIPIAVQITADHYGKYDAATRADIARLEAIGYPPLTLIREAPSPDDYAANFPGGICLQPYDRDEFRDRVSGVTLDALTHGCPIVATAGTWSADMIEPHGAGMAIPEPSAESLFDAVRTLIASYDRYRNGALAAAIARDGESWAPLLDRLRR